MSRPLTRLTPMLLALLAGPGVAQVIQLPLGNSSIGPEPSPAPVPTAAPTPAPSATPAPAPVATVAPNARPGATSRPRSTPTLRVVEPLPTPTATVTPQPDPAPVARPTPPVLAPTPAEPAVANRDGGGDPLWPFGLGVAVAAGAALAWFARRRSTRADPPAWPAPAPDAPSVPLPAPEPTPSPPGSAPAPALFERRGAVPRPRLVLDLRPTSVGLNLISATVDCEVTIANRGDAPATDVRAGLLLRSADAGSEPDPATLFAEPIARPATPPFDLAPGEEHSFRAVAALPLSDLRPVEAAGRPMFVPILALSVAHRDGEAARQVAQAFVVGIGRAGSAKLAPLWLDTGVRHYQGVAARPHGAAWQGA